MKRCPNCGTENDDASKYCSKCGSVLVIASTNGLKGSMAKNTLSSDQAHKESAETYDNSTTYSVKGFYVPTVLGGGRDRTDKGSNNISSPVDNHINPESHKKTTNWLWPTIAGAAVLALVVVLAVVLTLVLRSHGKKDVGDNLISAQISEEANQNQEHTTKNGKKYPNSVSVHNLDGTCEVISQIGNSPYYVVKVYETGLCGVFCEESGKYSVDPEYDDIQAGDDLGFIPACRDGYWGYIDCNGQTVIDFYYKFVKPFYNGYAVVAINHGNVGVIDQYGNTCLDYSMRDINLVENGIICKDDYSRYLLYDYSFNCVVSATPYSTGKEYDEFKFAGDYVFAERSGTSRYDVFSMHGSDELILTPEYVSQITGRATDDCYCNILGMGLYAIASVDIEKQVVGENKTTEKYLADERMNLVCSTPFAYLGTPNARGNLVAHTGYLDEVWDSFRGGEWIEIDRNGNLVHSLPEIDDFTPMIDGAMYKSVNDTYAYAKINFVSESSKYMLYDFRSGEWSEWGYVKMLDDTQCIIVANYDSGLYGIIDQGELVRECLYSDAVYEDGVVLLTRGPTQETYTPLP